MSFYDLIKINTYFMNVDKVFSKLVSRMIGVYITHCYSLSTNLKIDFDKYYQYLNIPSNEILLHSFFEFDLRNVTNAEFLRSLFLPQNV